jgi:hypothetical protein
VEPHLYQNKNEDKVFCTFMSNNRNGFTGGGVGGGGGECVHPLALARGGAIFHDKQKIIRGKMRYSNLSNNMMISEL